MTEEKLPPIEPQEAVNKAAACLRSLTHRAIDSDGYSVYRGIGGATCSIGAILPDDLYHEVFDVKGGIAATELKYASPELTEYFSLCSNQLLEDLQVLHDAEYLWEYCDERSFWNGERTLKTICEKHNLDYPEHP